jgi:hypothetical protein
MKRMRFGIILFLCGVLGVLSLLIIAIFIGAQDEGSSFGNSNLIDCLDFVNLRMFFYGFSVIGIIGFLVSVKESYFTRASDRNVKRKIFGLSLVVYGVIGVLFLELTAFYVWTRDLGSKFDFYDSLYWYGVTPYSNVFFIMGVIGVIVCVREFNFVRKKTSPNTKYKSS